MYDFLSYCPLKILTLEFCKFDILESIIARGLKLYQLTDDDKKIIG